MKEGSFYDHNYFVSMENRYWLGAHGERVRDILSYLPTGKRLLDYGAGSGFFSYQAQRKGNAVTSYDFAPSAIAYMRVQYPSLAVVSDARDLAGPFDAVLLVDVIEHIDWSDQKPFLADIAGFLPAGGRLIASTDNMDSPFNGTGYGRRLQNFDQRLSREGAAYRILKTGEAARPYHTAYRDSHVGLLGRGKLVALFEEAGFHLLREKHGFLYRSPLSALAARLLRVERPHSVYEFEKRD